MTKSNTQYKKTKKETQKTLIDLSDDPEIIKPLLAGIRIITFP
jgi:hypothetical protein